MPDSPEDRARLEGHAEASALAELALCENLSQISGWAAKWSAELARADAALLWARWAIGEEGQRIYAQAGETPAHPNVEPLENVRPAAAYMLSIEDIKEFPKYEKLWKEIFQIR